MNALMKLWLYKQWGSFRNLFRSPFSAIFTVFMFIVYGSLLFTSFSMKTNLSTFAVSSLHQSVLIAIGMAALMLVTSVSQKRQALFMQEDSFYLFSGPFSRKQVMHYLMAQTLLQSFMFSLISLMIMVMVSSDLKLTMAFLFMTLVAIMFLYMFFLIFFDYMYILTITNKRYKNVARVIMAVLVLFVVTIFIISLAQTNFDLQNGFMNFVENDLFYIVPMFGWTKLLLVSFFLQHFLSMGIALALLIIAMSILYICFSRFKGDFYEQAMMDSIEMSEYAKKARAGKQSGDINAKVHNANTTFRSGAGAIFSKNFLMMKKTRDFIRIQDLIVLIFYFAISYFSNLGFGFFTYMLILWLFQTIQSSNLVQEMKNYQIYLIPADPFEKLICVILPTLLKISILISVAVVLGGFCFGMDITAIILNLVTLLGYGLIFISGTVLSTRLLKSRTNLFAENFMRMFIILASAIPSFIIMAIVAFVGSMQNIDVFLIISISTCIANAIVSLLILYGCKGMMNGRELNSD